jgi:hypothetical protein
LHAPAPQVSFRAMSCLGVHFALTQSEVDTLRSFKDEQDRVNHLNDVLEEEYFKQHRDFIAETDKSWDALHRALSDGELTWEGGDYPLNHVVLAGELLCSEESYIMSLKTPEQVKDIAIALNRITEDEFRRRYFNIDKETYLQPLSEEDFGYTWGWFDGVRELYNRAAAANRFVLFTADQ